MKMTKRVKLFCIYFLKPILITLSNASLSHLLTFYHIKPINFDAEIQVFSRSLSHLMKNIQLVDSKPHKVSGPGVKVHPQILPGIEAKPFPTQYFVHP